MADISKEIQNFRSARKGRDVRGSMISLAEKVNRESTDAQTAASKSAADAGAAASNASYAVNLANQAAQNANTAAQNIQNKADQGDFTGTIQIGEVTTGEPGSQASANNSGTAKDAVINLTIPRGYQGVSMRMAGAWAAGTEYVNNSSYIDLVTYQGSTYGCKQSHTSSEGILPTSEEYWQCIAEKGETGNIENIDTIPIAFEEAAERENLESGDPIPTMSGKIKKWLSSLGQAAFRNVVNGVTQSEAGKAVLDAAVGKYLDEKKFDISRIVANRNITEPNFVMDGKTVADWFTELTGNMNVISGGNCLKIWSVGDWKNSGGNFPGNYGVVIRVLGYSEPEYFVGDSYFLAIVYTGSIYSPTCIFSGSVINQEQEVTWIPYVSNLTCTAVYKPIDIHMVDDEQGRRIIITNPEKDEWYGDIRMDVKGGAEIN